MFRLRALIALVGALGLGSAALTGCSGGNDPARSDGRVQVVAAFYPLQYAAQRVGGPQVDVAGLTKPGGEPHDVELTPRQVGRVALADLVVYERGFQPAVDAAVDHEAPHTSLDVSPAARLEEHTGLDT